MELRRNVESVGVSMENKTSLSNLGEVISVRGSVVDIRFDAYLHKHYY